MHHTVQLSPGKEKPVLQGHPWIFSGAIKKEPEGINPGDLIDVFSHKKEFLARGYYNPHSQIRIRVLTKQMAEMIDRDFFERRIKASISRRRQLINADNNAARLVAHESDLLPGLIVDRYGDWLSFQIVTAGMERWRQDIIEILKNECKPAGLVERSDEAVREKEGLKLRTELIFGENAQSVPFRENGMNLFADLQSGHKTGFYLDQRDNRRIVGQCAKDKTVLNCFSFSGGFTVSAMMRGAKHVVSIDESAAALEIAKRNLAANGLIAKDEDFIRDDVFKYLRELRSKSITFDMIILDPPKFLTSAKQIDKACRGYKDLNLLAMQLLNPGGLLATFSCSGLVTRELFQKVVFGASVDAKCEMQIVKHLSQAEDHPTLLSFPESLYLKGFLMQKIV